MSAVSRPPASKNWLIHRRSMDHRPAGWPGIVGAEWPERERPFPPQLDAPAGTAAGSENAQAALVRLHLEQTARADLHRQPAQDRVEEISIRTGLHPRREPPEPSSDRGIQLAGQDPPHLGGVQFPDGRAGWHLGHLRLTGPADLRYSQFSSVLDLGYHPRWGEFRRVSPRWACPARPPGELRWPRSGSCSGVAAG